ncbi:hypothetical protein ACFSLT_09360 [Novosphingobium resinovorum]
MTGPVKLASVLGERLGAGRRGRRCSITPGRRSSTTRISRRSSPRSRRSGGD